MNSTSAAYQVERRLAELGDSAAPHDRARAEMLIADARQAVKDDAPMDRVQSLTSANCSRCSTGYNPCRPAAATGNRPADGRGSPVGDDDVVDADSTGAEPPWSVRQNDSQDRRRTTTAADESPPEAVASHTPIRTPSWRKLEDRWRRAVADLDNLRKRYARELDRERAAERARVAGAWLPVVDNLERAIEHAGDRVRRGRRRRAGILDQALQVLEQLGYPRDAQAGVPFDPQRHEVVGVVDHAGQRARDGCRGAAAGLRARPRQLRPAAVVVSRREE